MGLLEELTAVGDRPEHVAGGHCSVGRAYQTLHEEHGPEVSAVLAVRTREQNIDTAALAEVLSGAGLEVSKQSLTRHRRRDCLCHIRLGI